MDVQSPNFLTCPMLCELEQRVTLNPRPKRKPRRGLWLIFFVPIFFLIVIACLPLAYGGFIAAKAATQLRATVQTAQAQIDQKDFKGAASQLQIAKQDLADLRYGLAAIGPWRQAPYLKDYISAFDQAGLGGEQTMAGLEELLGVAQSIDEALSFGHESLFQSGISPTQSFKNLTPADKRQILGKLDAALPRMRLAQEKLLTALNTLRDIRSKNLYPPLQQGMNKAVGQFESLYRRLDEGIKLAEVFLPMAGYPQAKNYLVILQNNQELRPTGGFIGTVGYARIDAADITDLWVKDVYSIDNPASALFKDESPAPIKRYLEQKTLFFRDSNWSPDFPTTAERLMDVYQRERTLANATTTPIDGLVALEPGFFRELLTLTGPITIEDHTFTAENFFDQLEWEVEVQFLKEGRPRPLRKEILAKLGDALIQKVKEVPSARWPELLDLATEAFEHKEIFVYVNDPATQALLDERGWSDRLLSTTGDYLWVVDFNMAAMKTDGVMDKQIFYTLEATSTDAAIATVRLHYFNTNKVFDWRYTRYRDYVRVYVPAGSVLLSSEGAMDDDKLRSHGKIVPGKVDVSTELGKTVFGTFWAIEPGETRDLVFKYRLPPGVVTPDAASYQLLVQKQPGTNTDLTLDLAFGKNIGSATPTEAGTEFGDNRYRLNHPIDKDTKIEVQF